MMVAGVPAYLNVEVVTNNPEQEATMAVNKKALKAIEEACDIKRQQGEEGGAGQVGILMWKVSAYMAHER